MPSVLLLLSESPSTILAVEQALQFPDLRVRSASSVEIADKWLETQGFEMVLLDSELAENPPYDFLERAWASNPLATCGVFSLEENFSSEAQARLMGAEVFLGPKAIEDIAGRVRQTLETFNADETLESGVLVVDDLDAPRDIICVLIESLGYKNVSGVSSATEALKLIEAEPKKFFCLVSDQNMPEVTGEQLVAQVRQDTKLMSLPIVMLTAYASPENFLDCLKAGASGFLVKPVKKEALRKELLKARRMFLRKQSPRLCPPEKNHLLEDAIARIFLRV